MNSNYATSKFLVNERINDRLGNAKYHRLAKANSKDLRIAGMLNNIRTVLVESGQWMNRANSKIASA